MDILELLKIKVQNALKELGHNVSLDEIIIEHSKDTSHGDYASNVAMKLSRLFGKNPREIAALIVEKIDTSDLEKIEIAGPGFINFYVKSESLQSVVTTILNEKENYGRKKSKNIKVNVEFVSANPTGKLHIGTARGAAYGDSLCRILDFAGYDVTREYYINDAGVQILNLALSIQARYKNLFGIEAEIPEDGYFGDDIKEIAQSIKDEIGDKALKLEDPISFFKEKGIEIELNRIVKDLETFRVSFDVFSSEKKIRGETGVEDEIKFLSKYTYSLEGALYLKTTDFLDDKDRVIVKSDGNYTYFLPDIVYHNNKMSRGFDKLIDVLGADHHGYINRMKSALMMHGYDKDVLDIELIQMVRFMKDGQEFKASKRSGDAITLRDVCEEVGVDAMRYFFAMRNPNSHLDFDMNLAVEQSSNNPVYYAQYAHARLCSILEQGKEIKEDVDVSLLYNEKESALMKHLLNFNKAIDDAANEKAPYKITNYIHELAELIHEFYSACRVIDKTNNKLSKARIALCDASRQVMKNALTLIGVNAPEHM